MPSRIIPFVNNQFYHVFNRGVEKRLIFENKRDYNRFIDTMIYYSIKNPVIRFSFKDRLHNQQNSNFLPLVEIVCYCLMPTHFHLLLKEIAKGGITLFMAKLSNSYTKYFNVKHNRVGPLLQGSFKAVRMEDEEQLIHVSRYIHLNPLIDYLVKNLKDYKFSSYLEYLNGGSGVCKKEYVLSHFSSNLDYRSFILDQEDYGRTIKNLERLLLNV